MAIVDFSPGGGTHKKKPVSAAKKKKILAAYAKIPSIKEASEQQQDVDKSRAEELLDMQL